jgi:hypothetical protein
MDSSARTYLIVGLVVGLILGILLGMALFWGLFPVKWTDANTYDLKPEDKARYMALLADSFLLDMDPARANEFLTEWTPEEKQQAITDAKASYDAEGQFDKAQGVRDLAMALGIPEGGEPAPLPMPPEPPVPGIWDRLRVPCLVFVLVLLALVLILIGVRALLKRRTPTTVESETSRTAPERYRPAQQVAGDRVPLGRFKTTYRLGEDTYDESFSIEAPSGEFLGECGMGISETIHDGEPDKVMAFEVWLFDKSDIRTVTKVLMSEHAFHDEVLRARLAPKGEAVLAQSGAPLELETSGLQVYVNITEMEYGESNLPANSFFTRLVVELLAMAKPGGAVTKANTNAL